ncbi:MAG: prolyl oligopeptidase family serine peptidase [Ruminococcaceae bacterium]|nr:prolyl oligopeptidase family serine peptidase [Oscillospiraceae bacterium]
MTAAILSIILTFGFTGCSSEIQSDSSNEVSSITENPIITSETGISSTDINSYQPDTSNAAYPLITSDIADLTVGTEEYRDFTVDNVYHSEANGDIHYNVYIPDSYDGTRSYALFFTLPGYEGLYFQGVASNIKSEEFGFEAQKYNSEMIVVAPQLSDWGETSAGQTIALLEFFLNNYNIDRKKVYANGFSGGGETMSIVMGKRPELFTAYLHCSSQWDGDLEVLASSRTPVYLAVGENDEYYGSEPTQRAYDTLYSLYKGQGLSGSEIDKLLVLAIKEHEYFTEKGVNNEHGGGGLFAFDPEIMGWLFEDPS